MLLSRYGLCSIAAGLALFTGQHVEAKIDLDLTSVGMFAIALARLYAHTH
jgi:hypothetical protein